MLTPREIIAESWAITVKERSLRAWGYASAFFETLRNVELLLYQGYYLYFFLFREQIVGWWSVEILLFRSLPLWVFIALTAFLVLLLLLQLFFPTLATGAIIGLAAKSYRKEEAKGGAILALYNFFPMLEIHGLFLLSSATVTFTAASFIIRYAAPGARMLMLPLLCVLFLISLLFTFFASFAEEGVVIRKLGVFDAIGKSFKMILSNLTHIMFLLVLLLVIFLRVLINAVVILLLPAIIVGIALLLTSFLTKTLSYAIAGIVGILLLFVVSYFFAYLQVFKQTVWTITYMELSKKKELDVIEEA